MVLRKLRKKNGVKEEEKQEGKRKKKIPMKFGVQFLKTKITLVVYIIVK